MHLFLHLLVKIGRIGVISMASYFIKKLPNNKSGQVRYLARIKHESRFIKSKTFVRKRDASEWAAGYVSNLENFRTGGKQPVGREHSIYGALLPVQVKMRDRNAHRFLCMPLLNVSSHHH